MKNVFKSVAAIFVFVIFLSTLTAVETSAQDLLGKVLRRMDAHNKNLRSLKANLTMVKHNPQLGETDINTGTVIYRPKPNNDSLIRLDWVKPRIEHLAVVNKKFLFYIPDKKEAYSGSTNAAKGKIKAAGALAFLNMSREQLRATYDIAYFAEGRLSDGTIAVQLRLTPRAKADHKMVDVWVNANGMPVQTGTTENNDDTTTILLTNIKTNETIDQKVFTIVLPRSVNLQPI